jgi:hypothetical protein
MPAFLALAQELEPTRTEFALESPEERECFRGEHAARFVRCRTAHADGRRGSRCHE